MSDPGGAAMAAGKSRRMAVLVMLLVAVGGGAAGVALDRLVLLPFHFQDRPFGPRRGGPPSPAMEQRARDRFSREIGLSPDQQKKVDSLIDRQMQELRAVRAESQPRLDTIFAQTRRSIEAILTPEQRAKAEELMRRGRGPVGHDRRGPDDRRDGPGGPGGPDDRGGATPPPDRPAPR